MRQIGEVVAVSAERNPSRLTCYPVLHHVGLGTLRNAHTKVGLLIIPMELLVSLAENEAQAIRLHALC
jgi:hypothetical protein